VAQVVGQASVNAIVTGRVQGVFYRVFVANEASRLGLRGMVRNLPDGAVEVHAEGPRPALERLVERLMQGSANSVVAGVEVEWSDLVHGHDGFRIEYT
jgi:acylphosphatase